MVHTITGKTAELAAFQRTLIDTIKDGHVTKKVIVNQGSLCAVSRHVIGKHECRPVMASNKSINYMIN